MKVAIFHHAYGRIGGAEIQTLYHSIGFSHYNHETKVFWSGFINNNLRKFIAKYGINFETIGVENIGKILNSLSDYDLIFLDHHTNPVLTYFIVKKYKEKTVWYCGDVFGPIYDDIVLESEPWETYKQQFKKLVKIPLLGNKYVFNLFRRAYRFLDQRTIKKISKIIANSNKVAKQIKKIYGRESVVVHPGIMLEEFSMRNKRLIDDKYILFVGALTERKNIKRVVKAFQSLGPKGVRLVIVGTGPLYNQISGKNITLFGPASQEELSSLYEHCEFVVYPTMAEAFGTVPLEAAIYKKPSIISEDSGLTEVFGNMTEAIHVNPWSIEDIKTAMEVLLNNKELRHELGKNAQKKTIEQLNIYEVCRKILDYIG